MRTTIDLDDDVAAAIDQARRDRGLGLSATVNELVRAALVAKPRRRQFRQRTADLSLVVDVTNVAEALEQLDGPARR